MGKKQKVIIIGAVPKALKRSVSHAQGLIDSAMPVPEACRRAAHFCGVDARAVCRYVRKPEDELDA